MADQFTIADIVAACKSSVHLIANRHTAYYLSFDEYVRDKREHFDDALDTETVERMRSANCIYELQFYPATPNGFHKVFGATVEECVTKAARILGLAMESTP